MGKVCLPLHINKGEYNQMAETTTRKTAPKTESVEDQGYVREIYVTEDIWSPADKEDKGNFLSIEDQMGNVRLNLTRPLQLSDQPETDHLIVRAPTTKEVQKFRSSSQNDVRGELMFFGGCCVGIKATDVENLHARDWSRLCMLISNFTS